MSAGKFVGLCFELRTAAHIAHLKSVSYSEHIALSLFYEGIVPLADSVAEGVQGRSGELITDYGNFKIKDGTPILDTLKMARTWIDKHRSGVSDASETQNDIDSIVSLLNSTIYKLEFLK